MIEEQAASQSKVEKKAWAIFLAVVLVVGLVAFLFKDKLFPSQTKYTAVFLDSGQVYFGVLKGSTLTNVYYMQVVEEKPQLVKMGSEVHAPEDEMKINPDHILFTERLKPEGQVVTAIKAFKP